jgi:hypothetical protein
MYILAQSNCRPKNSPMGWELRRLENYVISDLLKDFSDIVFVCSNTVTPGLHIFSLADFLAMPIDKTKTVNQMLSILDDRYIRSATSINSPGEVIYSTPVKSATYADALQAGWSFKTFKPNSHPDTENIGSQKKDLFLSKVGIDVDKAGKSLLTLVNGMAHYTYSGYNGIIASGAGETMRKTQSNLVSFINLGHIGDIEYVNLTSSMVSPGLDNLNTGYDGYLNLDLDLTGKSVILSIGGILYFEGGINKVVNRKNGIIKFNYHLIDHGTLYYEIYKHLKPETLTQIQSNIDIGILSKTTVYDNSTINELLDLPQTFAIIVDNPLVVLNRVSAKDGGLANVITSYSLPNKPLRAYSGRFLPYKFRDDKGKFSIFVDDFHTPVFMEWSSNEFNESDHISYAVMRTNTVASDACCFFDILTGEYTINY